MIVYFEKTDNIPSCIVSARKDGRKANRCYLCPVKHCTRYADSVYRVECDAACLAKIAGTHKIRIIKIIGG